MDVYFAFLLLSIAIPRTMSEVWSLPDFHDIFEEPTSTIKEFFEEQGVKMKSFVTESQNEAVKIKESLDRYAAEQHENIQQKVTNGWNNFVDGVEDSGRKITDNWSFIPENNVPGESRLDNPDSVLTVPSIISRHGYICETHTVISQGYVLNIHRIPHSKKSSSVPLKTVLLQHGLFASSADWIMNGPEKSLAFMLADAGYDVWMANIRGNRYSKEHVWLKSDSKYYWNFSWHDVAFYDIPEIIDYILMTKGRGAEIAYIGHSMGTTILFTMLSMRPEYNEKLTAGLALAPVAFLSDMKSPLKSLAPLAASLASLDMLQNQYEFIPKKSVLGKFSSTCDGQFNMDSLICKNVVFSLCGFNEKQFNKTLLPVFLAHLGTGTSWKTILHFSQEILSGGKFQRYDYGYYYNLKLYGSLTPPEYDLSKIRLPIKLFWSKNDLLSSEKDILALHEKLPSNAEMFLVSDDDFNHLDYLWAINAPKLVNNEVLKSLATYMNKNNYIFSFRI